MKSDVTTDDTTSSGAIVDSHRPRVIVVGSSNQDVVVTMRNLPAPGQTVIGDSLSRLPGGKGANQAVAAARVGADVVFVSAVGDDDAGQRTLDSLAAEGIDVASVRVHKSAPTGTAIVFVGADGENQIAIVQGANAALTGDDVRRVVGTLHLGPSDVVLVSFEISEEAVTAAAVCAAECGARLLVNPAPARELTAGILSASPILLPNSSEAQAISGLMGEEGAQRLHRMTGAPVIVTLGGNGVMVVDGDTRLVPAFPAEVVDTTGAGDTFAGILAARTAAGDSLDEAVSWAAAGAAISVSTRGAREGSPTTAQVEAKLKEREQTPSRD